MNWSEQYPNYHERMAVMEEAVYQHLDWWHFMPDQEPTLVQRDDRPWNEGVNE